MKKNIQDLVIVGSGIMGLMTAYYAAQQTKKVLILEKSVVGNKQAASFSYTRSMRNDYLDPYYSRLAYEAQQLWKDLQCKTAEQFIYQCGCLNLVKKSITPRTKESYAIKSYKNLQSLRIQTKRYSEKALQKKFPQFTVDMGCLDVEAGVLYLPAITRTILNILLKQKVDIIEKTNITSISEERNMVRIKTNKGTFITKKLVITAGIWTNEVIKTIKNCSMQFPISPSRPSQCKYYIPLKKDQSQFTPDKLPVFAYLDIGIYGHPILLGKTKGVKIGYYNPVDIKRVKSTINNIEDFVEACMPSLLNAQVIDVTDADQCYYDVVRDDDFIIGQLPGYTNVFIGTGWRGTGYKFAPLIGKILMQLSLQKGTIYNISRFSPDRFTQQ